MSLIAKAFSRNAPALMRSLFFFVFVMGFATSALATTPPRIEKTRPGDIVDVKSVDPSLQVDMIYAGSDNFVGQPIDGYKGNICFLSLPAAQALQKAQTRLQKEGRKQGRKLSLLLRDCYRPVKAVEHFLRWVKDPKDTAMKSVFYPALKKSDLIPLKYLSPVSRHSRASTVDLTITEIAADGARNPVDMGSTLDFFGEESHTSNPSIGPEARKMRQLLVLVMKPEFENYRKEWWHFELRNEPYTRTRFDFDVEERD